MYYADQDPGKNSHADPDRAKTRGSGSETLLVLLINLFLYCEQEDGEKNRFFSSLVNQLDTCPDSLARHDDFSILHCKIGNSSISDVIS